MPASVPNQGELAALKLIVANWDCRISLLKADPGISADTVWDDLVFADYDGYSDVIPTWSPPNQDGSGRAFTLSSTASFLTPDPGPQTIWGWVLWEFGFEEILEIMLFPTPIDYSNTSEPIEFSVVYRVREDTTP